MRTISTTFQKNLIALIICALSLFSSPAFAEGSKEFMDFEAASGGTGRFSLEFTTSNFFTPFAYRTILFAYVEAGEEIALGSSGIPAGGTGNIYVFPVGHQVSGGIGVVPNFSPALLNCVSDQAGTGSLTTRAQEIAGPSPAAGGYTPCVFTPPVSGIYPIVFTGPFIDGFTGNGGTINAPNISGAIGTGQESSVSVWDVTVRNAVSKVASTGRVFTNALFGREDSGGPDIRAYIHTFDGIQYETSFSALNGFFFNLFSDNQGVTQGGNRVYASTTQADIGAFGTSVVKDPEDPDTATSITNKMFFNIPDPVVFNNVSGLGATGWSASPNVSIPLISNFQFNGAAGGGGSGYSATGPGIFTFDSQAVDNGDQSAIGLDINGNGSFTDAIDVVLVSTFNSAGNSITFDGNDGLGNPLTSGVTYNAKLYKLGGEAHFPFIDVENVGGYTINRLSNPTEPFADIAYYNDLLLGTGVALTNVSPANNSSGSSSGPYPSTFRTFNGSTGDIDVLDTWSFYPNEILTSNLFVGLPEVGSAKSASSLTVAANGLALQVTYSLRIENTSGIEVFDIQAIDNFSAEFGVSQVNVTDVDAIDEYHVSIGAIDVAGVTNGGDNTFVADGNFNGDGATNLLLDPSQAGSLAPGDFIVIPITLTFVPDLANEPFTNQFTAYVDATQNGVANNEGSDVSTNGSDPDQNGAIPANDNDGDPTNTDSPTILSLPDNDRDGIPDALDIDDDNDGILDINEFDGTNDPSGDADSDGIPNYLDSTNDGSGAAPTCTDTTPNDGACDVIDAKFDDDLDGVPNHFDIDSDEDGIPDLVEAQGGNPVLLPSGNDADNDGLDDNFDTQPAVNNSATPAAGVGINPTDTDNDGHDDYLDIDSDNDGITDLVENFDTDGDGVADTVPANADADNDGLDDNFDNIDNLTDANASVNNPTNNGSGTPGALINTDSATDVTPLPNYVDIDADNDGIPDNIESQTTAAYVGPANNDADNDGLDDAYDVVDNNVDPITSAGTVPTNTDGVAADAVDYLDADSDNDGVNDINENGDSDNTLAGTDADNDGLDDNFDNVDDSTNAPGVSVDVNDEFDAVGSNYVATLNDIDNDVPNANGDGAVPLTMDVDFRDSPDNDRDGIPDALDIDDDNDGILDINEFDGTNDPSGDADSDGIPNYLDSTNDGSGAAPTCTDTTPNDGACDVIDAKFDDDLDGVPNHFDIDSDEDGIPDLVEAQGGNPVLLPSGNDADNDGLDDNFDTQPAVNNSATPAAGVGINPSDTDNDGHDDYLDIDSDNDGITDLVENFDTDGDGVVDATDLPNIANIAHDSDNDGLNDAIDTVDNTVDANASQNNAANADISGSSSPAALINTDSASDVTPLPNYLDIDADNDGIPDNVESQTTAGYTAPDNSDADMDGLDDAYDADDANVNPITSTGTSPVNSDTLDAVDYLDSDSDNDGVNDISENGDTDTTLAGVDTDGDGLDDNFDDNNTAANAPTDVNDNHDDATPANLGDADNDVPNANGDGAVAITMDVDYRDAPDNDRDGIPDAIDIDDDNDGILDINEFDGTNDPSGDADSDGIPNHLDSTNDGSGVAPTCTDTTPNDGRCDVIDPKFDQDQDGVPNHFDIDADNDGIPDLVEAQGSNPVLLPSGNDNDNDGLDDNFDNNDNDSSTGASDLITPTDTDGDGFNDYLDIDSDDDGITDLVENFDTDGDGVANTVPTVGADADMDGLNDAFDNIDNLTDVNASENNASNVNINGSATPDALTNTDGTGSPNHLDIDADDDGIPDLIESQTTNGYTPPDGADADMDGLDDAYDADDNNVDPIISAGSVPTNTDGAAADAVDYLDADSDNDGINDIVENGDTDNTLAGSDADNDGLDDNFDNVDNSAPTSWSPADDIGDATIVADLGDIDADVPNANGTGATPLTMDVDFRDVGAAVGLAKQAGVVTDNGDGSFTVPFTFVVENLGTQALSNISILDDLLLTFPAPTTFTIVNGPITTGGLMPNANFDGDSTDGDATDATDTNLLDSATSTLIASSTASIDISVRFVPNGAAGPFMNTSVVNAQTPSGQMESDTSHNGSVTDPDADGNADEAGENDPTPITITPMPVIGIAKLATPAVATVNAGEFETMITLTVSNLGNTSLQNVSLVEDLSTTFPSPATFSIQTAPVSSLSALSINPNFDGLATGDTSILDAATSTMAIGETATVQFTIRFIPGAAPQPFMNTVTASAEDPNAPGVVVTDTSDSGSDPDTDGDGNPDEAGENDPTPISSLETPVIGVAKMVGPVSDLGAGSYLTTVTFNVENLGNVDLTDVQVTDDLRNIFVGLSTYSVGAVTANGTLTANATFDGDSTDGDVTDATDINLLNAAASTLLAGQTETISVDVTFQPNGETGPFNNTAIANAMGPTVPAAPDTSDNGTDPDPDNNGMPNDTDEDDPSPITFGEMPVVGIAKSASTVTTTDGLNYQTTFTLTVENLGNVVLSEVDVIDDLSSTFPAPVTVTSITGLIASGSLTADTNYNGVTNTQLLIPAASTIALNGTETIVFTVNFATNGSPGPFGNQAVANAEGPGGSTTTDLSDDGTDPDPSDNNDPTEAGENDPTTLVLPANLTGTVWLDANENDAIDPTETVLAGWTIELRNNAGMLVSTVVTNSNGQYSIPGVTPGAFEVTFISPSGVTYPPSTVVLPAASNVDLPLPIDPSGVMYDSSIRAPLAGVEVQITDSVGVPLPAVCVLAGQQPQTTDATGLYRFDLVPGADVACPVGETEYRLEVITFPPGYQASTTIPETAGPLDATLCPGDAIVGAPCEIQAQVGAPALGDDTTYYTSFNIAAGDQDVINNHFPIDNILSTNNILLTKTAAKSQAVIGDIIQYTVRADSQLTFASNDIDLVDNIPAGFHYVDESALLIRAGADTILDTADDVVTPIIPTGGDPITFNDIDFAAEESLSIRYFLRVTSGVVEGDYTNTVTGTGVGGAQVTNEASATVVVVQDPLLQKTTIIGTVFGDDDADGWQDSATATKVKVHSDYFGWNSHLVGTISGRTDVMDPTEEHQEVVRMPLSSNNEFHVSTAEGTLIKVSHDGEVTEEHKGQKEDGLTAQDVRVTTAVDNGEMIITITNHGIYEHGIPGVRIATVEGLIIETDQYGRYHLADVDGGRWERGRNFIMKVDLASLPEGSEFTTENPRVLRITQGLMSKMNFGVKLPVQAVAYNGKDYGKAQKVIRKVEVVETRTLTNAVEAIRFTSGKSDLTNAYLEQLQLTIDQLADKDNVRIEVIGHTDNERLSASSKAKFGDNYGLSKSRAEMVAKQLQIVLGLPDSAITTVGRGADEPLASNNKAAGMAQNRRVEVHVLYDETVVKEVVDVDYKPLSNGALKRQAILPNGGTVWAVEDPSKQDPRLDILFHNALVVERNKVVESVAFSMYSNYLAFINHWEVEIYTDEDIDHVNPVTVITGKREDLMNLHTWMASDLGAKELDNEALWYVLKVYDAKGRFDETAAKRLAIVSTSLEGVSVRNEIDNQALANSMYTQNSLLKQTIPLQGSRVRINGAGLDPAYHLTIDNVVVPVAENGNFVYEQHLPMGAHKMKVRVNDESLANKFIERELEVDVTGKYLFMVGLANLTIGENSTGGNIEALGDDDHFDEDVWVDGRLAFYLKGKLKGKYLVTAQLDTTEAELNELGNRLESEDPTAIFRQLDPDQYYAVYGDDSTTIDDTDSQGMFYLRVDWDKSSALWGNYNTDLTGTEFAQYNRSLYGAKLEHRNVKTTKFGDHKHELHGFVSEAQTAAAHNEFVSTGGSLYYLRNTEVTKGSEKIWVEVRSRDTEQVVENITLVHGRDYDIDYLQGRIILTRPLTQIDIGSGPSIIKDTPLEGNDVFLLVDYEYRPDAFAAEDLTTGARGKAWVNDYIALGASYVNEERDGMDYELKGADLTLKAGKGTYIKFEYAESDAQQAANSFASTNGGLSFATLNQLVATTNEQLDGEAKGVETRINFAEFEGGHEGFVMAWYKDRDAGFSSTARLDDGIETQDIGVDSEWQATDLLTLSAKVTNLDQKDQSEELNASVQADYELTNKLSVGAELRYEDMDDLTAADNDTDALLGGIELRYEISDNTSVYASAQGVIDDGGDYEDNAAGTLGVTSQITNKLSVKTEVTSGDRGEAVVLGGDYSVTPNMNVSLNAGFGSGATSSIGTNYTTANGLNLYGSYVIDPDRTDGGANMFTLGSKRSYQNGLSIYSESQFGEGDDEQSAAKTYGLDFDLTDQWRISASMQVNDVDQDAGDIDRRAGTIGASFRGDTIKFGTVLEYREDDDDIGALDSEQWVTSNTIEWQKSDSLKLLSKLDLSTTHSDVNKNNEAKYVELDLGFAYRPHAHDRLNILGKYAFVYGLAASGQDTSQPDERAHVFSVEGIYDLNQRWEVGAKLAYKAGDTRLTRGSGQWFETGAHLAVTRARYHMLKKWDALLEYRWLESETEDDDKHGALLGVYRHVGKHMKIGAGYNFTDFNDDLTDNDYDSNGWFIDIIGKY